MNSTSKVLLAVIGAAAAGAIVGMLLAPEKGSDLRRKLSESAGDWSNQLNQLLASGKEQLNNLKSSVANQNQDLAEEETSNEGYDTARERM
ncbi:MAG TPA: YtxH domain-containing protein [Chryseosolibacter sp.]|nr:YtxH domain-containing protein [Chryseosolibacter sp.]